MTKKKSNDTNPNEFVFVRDQGKVHIAASHRVFVDFMRTAKPLVFYLATTVIPFVVWLAGYHFLVKSFAGG